MVRAVLALLFAISSLTYAQDGTAQSRDAIRKRLEDEYHLTKTTDDKTDIVTAGSVLVLHKDKVLMVAASSTVNPCMNVYKDGKIGTSKACGVNEKFKRWGSHIPLGPATSHNLTTRTFVSGEKFWVTEIDVQSSAVVLHFFTDAINDTRYVAALTVPFGAVTPSPEEALKTVREVITVAPADEASDSGNKGQQTAQSAAAPPAPPPAAPAPAVAEAAPPPLDIPPPPPADPVQIKLGQTKAQVVAALGEPVKTANTATGEIYLYKDLKVIFVKDKVSDVQ